MRVDKARRWSSPLVALATSGIVLSCLVTAAELALDEPALRNLTPHLGGWAGLAVIVATSVAALGMAAVPRVGPGPSLAVGSVGAVLGMALSRDVTSGRQLEIALLSLAVAVGACFAGGLALPTELPAPWSTLARAGSIAPLAAGWAPLAWLTLHARPRTRLVVGLPTSLWPVVAAAVLLTTYGALSRPAVPIVDAPATRVADRSRWQNAWAALATLVVGIGSVVMLVGFQTGAASWVRPVVLLTTASSVAGLAVCGWLVPDDSARAAYAATVVALATGPSCIALLLLVAARASGPLSTWTAVALTAAALVGVGVAWWAARRAPTGTLGGSLLVLGLGAGAAWVMPTSQLAMVAACAPLCAGVGAAVTAGLQRGGATSPEALRFVGAGGLAALVFGLMAAFPLTWALGAELSGRAIDDRAGGRVLLGLTFAIAVPAAAVSVLGQPARQGGAPDRRTAEPCPPPGRVRVCEPADVERSPERRPGGAPRTTTEEPAVARVIRPSRKFLPAAYHRRCSPFLDRHELAD